MGFFGMAGYSIRIMRLRLLSFSQWKVSCTFLQSYASSRMHFHEVAKAGEQGIVTRKIILANFISRNHKFRTLTNTSSCAAKTISDLDRKRNAPWFSETRYILAVDPADGLSSFIIGNINPRASALVTRLVDNRNQCAVRKRAENGPLRTRSGVQRGPGRVHDAAAFSIRGLDAEAEESREAASKKAASEICLMAQFLSGLPRKSPQLNPMP